ncbi:vanadium-dependent haloperoxidase [Dactylosporangium matsuzakiense]|nr:vanadium-dependent haloperoxidase [Dactylosporangium matsuzakiense]
MPPGALSAAVGRPLRRGPRPRPGHRHRAHGRPDRAGQVLGRADLELLVRDRPGSHHRPPSRRRPGRAPLRAAGRGARGHGIAFYDAKYHFRIWRPVTAIRELGDPQWLPLAPTPADPSYVGAHSAVGQAAATVLAATFGQHQALSVTSESLPGVSRTFRSLQAAADEAGLSRIYAGVHTRIDHRTGQELGIHVARYSRDG